MKTCTKCQICKPLFSFTKHSKTKDGLRHWCRDCQRCYMQKYKKDNPEIVSAQKTRYRLKYKEVLRSKNRTYSQIFRKLHKEELSKRSKQRRIDDPIYKEKRRAAEIACYFRNQIARAESRRRWANANKALIAHYVSKRRIALANRVPNWLSQDDWVKIKAQYQCAKDKSAETGQKWVVDHVIPLRGRYVSGLHVPQNLQILTISDNSRKYNKFDINKEWAA